jgi:hypothetical protein
MLYRLKVAVFFIFSMLSAYASAVSYSDNDYSYYKGDYDKDGIAEDIILVAAHSLWRSHHSNFITKAPYYFTLSKWQLCDAVGGWSQPSHRHHAFAH